jgi:hypothetical protein
MPFIHVSAALRDLLSDSEADEVLTKFLPQLSMFCACDEDAWSFLSCIAPNKIGEMSGLGPSMSQRLKDVARKQQQRILSGVHPAEPAVPPDELGRLQFLLASEGFEVWRRPE